MARVLDTSVLIRYLTGDDASRSRLAERIIESDDLVVTTLILSEAAYVLRSQYGHGRLAVLDTILEFLQRDNVDVLDAQKDLVWSALDKTRSGGLSLGDALILGQMRSAGIRQIYSFDKDFRDPAIEVLEGPIEKEAP